MPSRSPAYLSITRNTHPSRWMGGNLHTHAQPCPSQVDTILHKTTHRGGFEAETQVRQLAVGRAAQVAKGMGGIKMALLKGVLGKKHW